MNNQRDKLQEIIKNNPKGITIIMEVINAIGDIPEEKVNDYLLEIETDISAITSEELVSRTIDRFKEYRKTDIEVNHNLPKVIEEVLNSKEVEEILSKVLSNVETLCEHSLLILDGTPLGVNIYITRLIVGFLTDYIVVHQGAYDMEEVYQNLQSKDLNKMTESEINTFFAQIIAKSTEKKLGVSAETEEGKKQIAEYVYKNFIENGYCYQGTNSAFRQSVEENGLTPAYSKTTDQDLVIVAEIFRKHGVDKIFYSKLSETKVSPYYYTTDGMDAAYHYSYHNPEYFAYFVASGNYMPDQKYNRGAYYLRDYEGCRNNVETLCKKYHLSEEESQTVLKTFERLANTFINDNPNTVTLVSRKLLNKNKIPFDFSSISSRSIESIIGEITQTREGSTGTKQNISIPANQIDVISVPTLAKFYDKEKVEAADKRKYIVLDDGTKYYYDILIHADKVNYDCISISEGPPTLYTLTSRDSRHKGEGTINVITCPSNLAADDILSNGNQSFQSLQMMIAVNGKANSQKGQELIEIARQNYSPEYMSNYYYHLCGICCDIAADKSVDKMTRCQAMLRMAKDFYPKAELMRVTGEYPEFVSEENHLYEYLSYYDHLQVKTVEHIKNGSIKEDDDSSLDYLASEYTKKIEGKINKEFTEEFMNKAQEYGIIALIERIHQTKPNNEFQTSELSIFSSQNDENVTTEISNHNTEMASMFQEQTSSQHSNNSESPKVYTMTTPSSNKSTGTEGKTNTSAILIIMVITIIALIYLLILK